MNKKIVIIIVAIVAALALLITGTVLLLGSKFTDAPDKDASSQSEVTSGTPSSQVSGGSTQASSDSFTASKDDSNQDSTVSVPKVNTNKTTVIVDNVTAEIGGKVSVPVYVSSNKGFMGIFAKFQYDTASLKYTGFKKGDILTDYELKDEGGLIKFMSIERGDVTKDGVMLYLEFDVISTTAKTTPVKVTVDKNGIANQAEQYVDVATINGTVKIK